MYIADAKRLTLAGARKMMATAMDIAEAEQIPIAVTRGVVTVHIGARYPLAEVARAHADLQVARP